MAAGGCDPELDADKRIPDLPAYGRDAAELAATLTNPEAGLFPQGNVTLLLNGAVTRASVVSALDVLARRAGKDDLVVQAPGIPLRKLVEQHCQGVRGGKKFKGAIAGGVSMGVLGHDQFDAAMDFDIGRKYQVLGLGTACPTIFDEDTDMVAVARNVARFFMRGSQDIGPGTTICGPADGNNWAGPHHRQQVPRRVRGPGEAGSGLRARRGRDLIAERSGCRRCRVSQGRRQRPDRSPRLA